MKYLLMGVAYLCIVLGSIGIFLPIWPTVPFYLLAAVIFYYTSPKAHKWMMNHKVFGPYIRDFMEHRTIPLRAKILSLTMMWLSVFFSVFYLLDNNWLRGAAVVLVIGASFFILSFKTSPKKPKESEAADKKPTKIQEDVILTESTDSTTEGNG